MTWIHILAGTGAGAGIALYAVKLEWTANLVRRLFRLPLPPPEDDRDL